jgi:hypothetical protein
MQEHKKGQAVVNAELVDLDAYSLQTALEKILEVCNGFVGTGPLKTIAEIASDALDKNKKREINYPERNEDVPCDNRKCSYLDEKYDQNCSCSSDIFGNPYIERCISYIPKAKPCISGIDTC